MLIEIKTKEIMTAREACRKYNTKYFIMIITQVVDNGDNDLGYVLYAADTEKELAQVPRENYKDKCYALMQGGAAEPFPSLDRVVYHAHV